MDCSNNYLIWGGGLKKKKNSLILMQVDHFRQEKRQISQDKKICMRQVVWKIKTQDTVPAVALLPFTATANTLWTLGPKVHLIVKWAQ